MNIFKTSMLASALALGLAACGGGGGESNTPTSAASDELVGTWANFTCQTSLTVQEASGQPNAGSFVHQKIQLTMTKSGASTLDTSIVTKFYASADSGCIGTVLNTETRNNHTVTLGGGTKSMTTYTGTVTATKFNLSGAAIGGFSSGGRVEVGALSYPGDYFTVATNDDYYFYIYESGKLWYEPTTATSLGGKNLIRGIPF